MATEHAPAGPPLADITEDDLDCFRERLRSATYRRGPTSKDRGLSEISQIRTLQEVQIVLAAAGPRGAGRGPRAGWLQDPPLVYCERPTCFPPSLWRLEEARGLVVAIGHLTPCPVALRASRLSVADVRAVLRAVIAFWFYTGHRATTIYRLPRSALVECDGDSYLRIARSVKTGKPDQVRVHPRLLTELRAVAHLDAERLVPVPVTYSTLANMHERLQVLAGLSGDRIRPVKTWRAMHASYLARCGVHAAEGTAVATLGHGSADVTRGSYVSVRDLAIPLLPDLFTCEECDHDSSSRTS